MKERKLIFKEELLRKAPLKDSLQSLSDLSLAAICMSLPCHSRLPETSVLEVCHHLFFSHLVTGD